MKKLILGMNTIGKDHWIKSFETVSYKLASDLINSGADWFQMYAQVSDKIKHEPYETVEQNINDYVLLDEKLKVMSVKSSKQSIIIDRDGVEMTNCQGNVCLNEHYNPSGKKD